MALIEEQLWAEIVQPYLATGAAKLQKKEQQDLATALQAWAMRCISSRLEPLANGPLKEEWQIKHKGKDFLGAVRWQEVDVWLSNPEVGLALAVDPKHFQSEESLKKNWKNGHNDLVAFATNIHERFPLCAVGGVIAFPAGAATESTRRQMVNICSRSIPREKPQNVYGKFEGFALAIYDEHGNLIWPLDASSPLKPSFAFQSLANTVFSRTLGML